MGLSRRQFTKEFKLAAVRRLEAGLSITEVRGGLEINPNVLRRWRRQFRQGPGSFMKTLKYEEVYRNEYCDLAEAHAAIGVFLEKVYNQKRLHSALGYVPPIEFEAQLATQNQEAAARQLSL
jgi:transposase InsO family protein